MSKAFSTISFAINEAKSLLPPSVTEDNKSSRGRSLLIAGSEQYPGAGVLCSKAALRAGSGYVYLAQKVKPSLALLSPEVIPLELNLQNQITEDLAIALGPGTGLEEWVHAALVRLSEEQHAKLVIDADALTMLSRFPDLRLHPDWIFTPHEGELARLLNVTAEQVRQDRVGWILQAQERFGCVIVLKGHRTLVADGQSLTENLSGNAGLAKTGTGDVLTGIITAFRAQGLSSAQAARLGVFVHGVAADLWIQSKKDFLALTASDVIENLPQALFEIRSFSANPSKPS